MKSPVQGDESLVKKGLINRVQGIGPSTDCRTSARPQTIFAHPGKRLRMVSGYPRHLASRQDYQAEFGDLFVPAIVKKISDFGGSLVKNPPQRFSKTAGGWARRPDREKSVDCLKCRGVWFGRSPVFHRRWRRKTRGCTDHLPPCLLRDLWHQ